MRTTGQTRVEKSSEDILQYIKDHNLTAGDKLPTEMELSKLLGVGRNTVREALRLLLSRNIVVIRQGAGSFVSDKNGISDDPLGFFMVDDRKKLIEDLLQARVIIEPQIASIAAQNRTEEELARLIGGAAVTDALRKSAAELLDQAESYRKKGGRKRSGSKK